MKKITKEKQKISQEWIANHGGCSFDLKNEDIILYDNGLFWLKKIKYKTRKFLGTKKMPNGNVRLIFSKKAYLDATRHDAIIWISELGETIKYLQSMRKMLKKLGFDTDKTIRCPIKF